jgi:hypothetical protein
MIEIARSFSRKVNLGNYQTVDFFCSAKQECEKDEIEGVSNFLNALCIDEVSRSITEFKEFNKPTSKLDNQVVKPENYEGLEFKDVKLNGD